MTRRNMSTGEKGDGWEEADVVEAADVVGAEEEDVVGSERLMIDRYAGLISEALKEGALPRRGSLMPHLLFILTAAYDRSTDATATGEFAAAILGLNSVCGAQEFAAVVDELTKGNSPTGRRGGE